MASLNGMLTYLEHIDLKKNSLRKAILTLAVEWKDLDEHLDSTKNCIDACVIELDLKQKILESNQDSVTKNSKELDEARGLLDVRLKEFEERVENFRRFQLSQVEKLELKEKQLDEVKMWIEERIVECETREEKLSVQKKSMEVLLHKIEMEKHEFEEIQKSVGEKLEEVHLKERKYEDLCKEVSLIQDRMETWAKELNSKEEKLIELQRVNEERGNELDIIAREYKMNKEGLNLEKRSIEVKLEEFESTKKSVDEKLNEISFRERNCDNLSREANLIQDWIERRSRELYAKEEEFTMKEEQLITRQRLNEDRTEELDFMAKEYELKEKKLEIEKAEFQNIRNDVNKKWNEISTKERYCDIRCKQVNSREEQVTLREKQLKEMQNLNEECSEELHLFEKECRLKEEKLLADTKSIEEQLGNIENKKKQLNEISLKNKHLDDRSKELNSIQDWIERRAKELDLKEEQFALREEKLSMEKKSMDELLEKINLEKEDINSNRRSIAEKLNEINLKERNYEDLSKDLDSREKQVASKEQQLKAQLNKDLIDKVDIIALLEKIEKEKVQFEDSKRTIGDELNKLSLKEKKCEYLSKEVSEILDKIERRTTDFDSKKERVALRENQIKAMKKLNKERCEELSIFVKECNLLEERLNCINNSIEVLSEEIKKEKECNLKEEMKYVAKTSIEVLFDKFEKLKKEFEDIKKSASKMLNDVSLKEKNYEDLSKEVHLILDRVERQLEEKLRENDKDEQVRERSTVNLSVEIPAKVTMDGRGLRLYMKEHYNDRFFSKEVSKILKLLPDPANLVLEAIEGFYSPHLRNGEVDLETTLGRRSCILLLEELISLSPKIHPQVREAALKLSSEWKVKMKLDPKDETEVEGFILLLASYKLASDFDDDELLKYLELFAMRPQAPQIWRALGLEEKVPEFITRLVEGGQRLSAINYIYAFDLVNTFSPFSILEDFINSNKVEAEKIRERSKNSSQCQYIASKLEISAFEAMQDCISCHKLDLKLPFLNLKPLVQRWEIQIFGCKRRNLKMVRRSRGRKTRNLKLPSTVGLEPHFPQKRQRATLSAGRMFANYSESSSQPFYPPYHHSPYDEFPMEHPPNTLPPIGDYNQNWSGDIPKEEYPAFGFGGDGNFDFDHEYNNIGPFPDHWGPVVPPSNMPYWY